MDLAVADAEVKYRAKIQMQSVPKVFLILTSSLIQVTT
jgi:hypothetical protein